MTDKAPELKPCPFCGDPLTVNKAKMVVHSNYDNSECPLFTRGFPADHDASVKAWNRRADLHVKVKPLALAKMFHETYETLAPEYGYDTRKDTRNFDPQSPNGKLMVAVSERILSTLEPTPAQAAIEKLQDRLDKLTNLCANAERRGPSFKGYVNDATYHHWCGQRSALHDALRAIAEGENQ